MEFIGNFFDWAAVLSKKNPALFGLVTVGVMCGMGLVCAAVADIVFKILGINLGKYDHGPHH